MVIDTHTHLWPADGIPLPIRRYAEERGESASSVGADELLASMDEVGIDGAIVLALPTGPRMTAEQVRVVNAHVRTEVQQSAGRLIGFCTVDPWAPDATSTLRGLIEHDGFRGLKLHGSIQELPVDHANLYPLYAAMEEYGLPVLLHTGGMGVRPYKDGHTQASMVDTVACDFPSLPIVLGHSCRIDYAGAASLLRKHPQVYAEISSNLGRTRVTWPLRQLLDVVTGWAGGTDRILFGSDYPLYSQSATKQALDDLAAEDLDFITSAEIDAIWSRNAQPLWHRLCGHSNAHRPASSP